MTQPVTKTAKTLLVSTLRKCRVAVAGADGVIHSIEVSGTKLFEVAAAVAQMREEGWTESLAPTR